MVKKIYCLTFSVVFLVSIFFPNIVYAAMPEADGIDYGTTMIQPYSSSYKYLSSSFSIGAYLNDGNAFKRGFFAGDPYYKTSHEKVTDNSPNTYRVTYQILDEDGDVISGKSFSNDVSDKTVSLDPLGYKNIIGYVAGDGTNSYKTWGTFNY